MRNRWAVPSAYSNRSDLRHVIGPFLGGAVEGVVGMRPVFYISGYSCIHCYFGGIVSCKRTKTRS